jgi:O-antigen/teichoic acid export membrane protein
MSFVSNGIDMAYVRFAAEEFSAKKKISTDIFVFSIVLCISIFIVLSPLVFYYSRELSALMFRKTLFEKPLLLGFIAAIGLFLIGMISRYYQVQERYKKAGVIISLEKILFFLAVVIVFLFWELSFLRVAILKITLLSLFSAIFIVLLFKNILFTERFNLHISRFYSFLKVSFWLILYFITLALFSQLDIFMISRLLTSNDLADYGVAFKYYGFLMLMFPSIKTVLKVRTAKIDMVESVEKQKAFYTKWMRTTMPFLIFTIVIIILSADYLMNLLNGPKYVKSIFPFKILAVSAMCSYFFSPNADIFRTMKKYFILFCFGFSALIINFFGNLWLIPVYNIKGAAVATLISHLFINGAATVYLLLRKTDSNNNSFKGGFSSGTHG